MAFVAATALAVSCTAAALFLTACRLFTPSPRLLVLVTAFVPFALVGHLVGGLSWSIVWRSTSGVLRWVAGVGALVSLLGLILHGALLAPAYVGGHASGTPDLTVLTANLRLGQGDPERLTRLAEDGDADVVVLEEVTPSALATLDDLRAELPHVAGAPFEGARGTMVFSRYPLENPRRLWVFQGAWLMQVSAPRPFSLVAVHSSQPKVSIDLWRSDQRFLLGAAARTTRTGPVVMAGDFNATLDHAPMRRLLGLGLSDAAREANSGWQPTWPGDADVEHALPFGIGALAIDHVLVSKAFSAISTDTYSVKGSDHRALLARIAVR